MNSPGHRAAILAKDAKEIGVGLEIDNVLGDAYWVQTFGNPFTTGSKAYFSIFTNHSLKPLIKERLFRINKNITSQTIADQSK